MSVAPRKQGRARPVSWLRNSPAAGRRVIEGTHLLGAETGAAGSTRRALCCYNTTNAGRPGPRIRGARVCSTGAVAFLG